MTSIGHNSLSAESKRALKEYVDRLVAVAEEIDERRDDLAEIYEEAQAHGFARKAVRALVKFRMETVERREKREQLEAVVETYMEALGDFASTDLGQAALERAAAHA
jgi:uncharacterized protein (UPF0335 family)